MLHARDIDEQRDIYAKEIQPVVRARTTRALASLRLLLFGLGIPPVQYDSLKGGRSISLVLEERIERAACEFDLKENYFAWQFFHQGYAAEGEGPLPIYLQRDYFDVIKSRVDRLDVHHTSYIDHLRTLPDHYLDRYVLLDAQDWMDDQTLTELWSEVTRTARPESRVIFRTAGIDSVLPGRIPAHLLDRWSYHEETSMRLLAQDRSAVYGGFHLYTLKGAR
jgi:S-adenosylmethionine-diacylglycerol 3-amino-3-carboxypropyl transferase